MFWGNMLSTWFGESFNTYCLLSLLLHPHSLNITYMQPILKWVFLQTAVLLLYYPTFPPGFPAGSSNVTYNQNI